MGKQGTTRDKEIIAYAVVGTPTSDKVAAYLEERWMGHELVTVPASVSGFESLGEVRNGMTFKIIGLEMGGERAIALSVAPDDR